MADLFGMLQAAAGAVPTGPDIDPNFNQTVLLLHGDGTNGAQNNTFLDGSTNNFTITRNGNTTQGTFSPFSAPDGRWSNYFDGTGDWVEFGSSADFAVGSVVTLECWFYPLAQAGALMMGTVGTAAPQLGWQNSTTFGVASVGIAWRLTSATIPTLNAWNHVAFVRTGTGTNEASIFLNGTRIANGTVSDAWTSNTGFTVGAASDDSAEFTGYIANARVVKGTAVYSPSSTTITVPTSPFSTSTANQKLLTCYSNRFVDANTATTAKAITVDGNPKVTPFSPFAPTAAYDASVNGGSGYFDGTGDYLSIPSSADFGFGTGDFTIECWVYPLASTAQRLMFGGGDMNNLDIGFTPANTFQYWNGTVQDTGVSAAARQWFHFAASRTAGTTSVYVNGVRTNNVSDTSNTSARQYYVAGSNTGTNPFNGYISNARIIKGTGIYSGTTITVPTAPFTAISNTKLLLNFTNAGIFDNTGKNNLETVADAQIDTTTKKYGTGSMEFDGTGDYLKFITTPDTTLGSGDLTIEGWLYSNDITATQIVLERRAALAARGLAIFLESSALKFRAGNTNTSAWEVIIDSSTLSSTTWYHFAFTRSGTTWRGFVNGTQVGSDITWDSTVVDETSPWFVGAALDGSSGTDGLIDDLRITKGVARYTAAFTPPAKEFPNL